MEFETPQEFLEAVKSFVVKNEDKLDSLYCRWLDEREYEDLADYQKVIESMLAKSGLKAKSIKPNRIVLIFWNRYQVTIRVTNTQIVAESKILRDRLIIK